jgi:hypothetical protein
VLKIIIVFLLGAGFSAGAFLTGITDRMPHFMSRMESAAVETEPSGKHVVVRVAASSDGCSPEYSVSNRSATAVYFSLPETQSGTKSGLIRIPAGASLTPSHLHQTGSSAPEAADSSSGAGSATTAFRLPAKDCVPSLMRIVMTDG